MTTSNESEEAKRPLKLNQPGKLQLKKTVETGQVRQSFSHGRSKAVTVEVKRSRTFERGSTGRMAEVTEAPGEVEAAVSETPAPAPLPQIEDKPARRLSAEEIGRAHVWTPVTNAHLVCRLLLEKKTTN